MTSKESLALVAELREKMRATYDLEEERLLEKQWIEAIHNIVPEVGMKCTIVYFSDYRAATVVEVNDKLNKVGVKFNKVECKDWYAGVYEIYDELDDFDNVQYFTKRRNGQWVLVGHQVRDGVKLALHYQRHYIDPEF